jgi:putative transposase
MALSPLNALPEAERALAFERFELLRPALDEGVPLARVARDRGIALRTAHAGPASIAVTGLLGWSARGEATGANGTSPTRYDRRSKASP